MDDEMRQQKEEAAGEEHRREEAPPDLLERAVSWLSMALVVALAGFLLWEALQQTAPVAITARAEAPWQAGDAYYLPLEIRNAGGRSVQSLHLQVQLVEGGQVIESSQVTLSWLPVRSSRRAVAAFQHDPRAYDVQVTPKGYEQP